METEIIIDCNKSMKGKTSGSVFITFKGATTRPGLHNPTALQSRGKPTQIAYPAVHLERATRATCWKPATGTRISGQNTTIGGFVYRKKGVSREKTRRKEKRGVKTFTQLARNSTSAYVYHSGLRVRPLNCHFQQLPLLRPRVIPYDFS